LATFDVQIDNSFDVRLQIWDFAGEKRFRLFLPNYSRGATGCLLCYDITRRTSFDSLEEWYKIVNNNADNPIFILVGEKLDLADIRRSVLYEDAEDFKRTYNLNYFFETSSKSGENNKMIFETLTRSILKKKKLLT
jgi:small GTP-binding protein